MYRSAKGFSLLEVLVAFVILAMVLGVLMQIFSGGLRNTKTAGEYQRAMLLAQNKMESIGIDTALVEGISTGEFDDIFRWKLKISPYQDDGADNTGISGAPELMLPVKLLEVELVVEWQGGSNSRLINLRTIRLANRIDI